MISKIWLIQKSDGEFIDYVYTTKQLAECRTRHQQDGATLTIQEWVLADRPALSGEAPDPREWLIHGGGGHEGGAGGLRSLTVSGGGLIDFLESYRDAVRGEAPAAKASGEAKADARVPEWGKSLSQDKRFRLQGAAPPSPQAGEDEQWARKIIADAWDMDIDEHVNSETLACVTKLVSAIRAAERNRARREALAVAIKAQDWFGDHAVMHCELRDNERCHWCTFIAELRALATRTEAPMAPEGKGTTK